MSSSDIEELAVSREGAAALITLNRPQSINAVNDAIREVLPELFHQFDADPSVTAIVIAGAGERGFCAGADIKEARAAVGPAEERRRLTSNSWIDRVAATVKPTIAVMHGVCMGAGFELALACDIRIGVTGARIGLPETALGLIPGGGGTQRLTRLVGAGRAMDMILTGRILDVQLALAAGIVTRIAETRDEAIAEAMRITAVLAERPPLALAYAKEAILAAADMQLAEGLRMEKSLFAILASTEDRREAAAAFRDKRKPRFEGK